MPPHDARILLAVLDQHDILPKASLPEIRPLVERFPAAADLARELVRRGLLTTFQANEIMQDRAARLNLGQYLLLERLGQGGMGEVFKARHRVLDRFVALKVIRPEFVNHADAVERFRRECRAAGRLSHPNIVTVHDAHQAGDVHFMAMEYLDGKDLGRLLKEGGPLPPGDACDYARQAALGLQHAHEKGMVHRDVKPANLMLTTGGVVKVLDLGLARLRVGADAGATTSDLTRAGSIMGTPDYMAPEQAAGDSAVADGRADVYSLGCTLFHLLTGRPPFPGKTAREKIAAHLCQPPPRVDEIRPGLHPGLAGVVRRMMEKDPAARYPTAGAAGAALLPFCGAVTPAAPAPVAGPDPMLPTATYVPPPRGGRNFRRWGIAAAVLLGGLGIGLLAWWMFSPPPHNGPPVAGVPADKDKGRPPDPGPPVPPVVNLPPPQKHAVREGVVWPPPDCVALLGDDAGRHWGEVQCVAFRPDGKLIAACDRVGGQAFIHLWDAASLKERAAWTPAGLIVQDMAFSPNGRLLAAVCGDGVRLWDAGDDGLSHEHKFEAPGLGPGSNVQHLRFAADGILLTWDAAGVIRKWDVSKGDPTEVGEPTSAPPQVSPLTISADGGTLAYGMRDPGAPKPGVYVRTLFDKKAIELSIEAPSGAGVLALSADGKRLAARLGSGEMHIWDVDGGKLNERTRVDLYKLGLSSFLPAFQFTPDGGKVVCLSTPRAGPSTVWLIDATTGDPTQLEGLDGPATCLSMPADGRMLAVAGKDHRLRLWDAKGASFVLRPSGPAAMGVVQRLAFRRGGEELAVISRLDDRPEPNTDPSNLIIWDVSKGKDRATVPGVGWFTDCAYAPDGSRLFAAGATPGKGGPVATYREGFLRVWQADSLKEKDPPALPKKIQGISLEALAFDREGNTLVLLGGDDAHRQACVCDVQPFRVRGNPFDVGQMIDSLALASDGATAATLDARRDGGQPIPFVKFWNLKDIEKGPPEGMTPNPALEGAESQFARRLTFSPDGKTIAALVQMGFPSDERKVLVWTVATGSTRAVGDPKDKRPSHVGAFAFSPDGRTLATADADGRVTLWRADKSDEKTKEWEFPGPVYSLAFDPSGTLLAAGDGDGTIAVLRLPAPP